MPVQGCNTITLLQLSKCLLCLSETDLLAVEVLVREQSYASGAATTPRTPQALLAASIAWQQLSEHDRQAMEAEQLCNEAVITGARSVCDATTLMAEIKCYCAISKSQLQAIIYYLKCLRRQT